MRISPLCSEYSVNPGSMGWCMKEYAWLRDSCTELAFHLAISTNRLHRTAPLPILQVNFCCLNTRVSSLYLCHISIYHHFLKSLLHFLHTYKPRHIFHSSCINSSILSIPLNCYNRHLLLYMDLIFLSTVTEMSLKSELTVLCVHVYHHSEHFKSCSQRKSRIFA